jgi:hypothetical protein
MNLFKRRVLWLGRAWPLWLIILASIITTHYANWTPPPSSLQFNKIAGAAMQGLGAFLVLVSINGDLGLFRGHGVVDELRAYIRAYPRRNKIVSVVAVACGQASASGALGTVRIQAADIDGRVGALEKLYIELESKIVAQRSEILAHVDEVRVEHREALGEHGRRVDDLAKKVEETAVGSMKLQAFGVGLAVIGSVLSIYS